MTTTSRAHRARLLALPLALLLLVAACGSRVDSNDASGDDGLDSSTTAGGGDEGGGALGPDSAELGTIANPCSGEVAEGAAPTDTPGVTDDTIRIGVISDKENPAVPLPTVGIEESVTAFVEFCNDAGGINGRTLELQTYDSEISRTEEVTQAACRDDLFALVGDGSVQDQQGIDTRIGCGLPEVAAYSATAARSESDLFFQPVVGTQSAMFNVGPCQYIAEQFPDAISTAATVYTDLPAASNRAEQQRDACTQEAGLTYVVEGAQGIGDTNYTTTVADMKSKGVKYLTAVSSASETLALLDEVQTQGLELDIIDLGQQYYDPAVASAASASGAYVLTNTVPFSETKETPVLQLYTDYMDKTGAGEDKITTLGVQAFSAGLLFATAANEVGNDLNRDALVAALEGITEWDGGGIQMPSNPGEKVHNSCFLYLKVEDGEFVRQFPDEGFECDDAFLVELDKSYG